MGLLISLHVNATTHEQINVRTIAILSQKGGVGKTTLALHLAAAASAAGLVSLVVDTDPQATACTWHSWRGSADPDVIRLRRPCLTAQEARPSGRAGGRDLAVIDTPPHADLLAREAGKLADLLFIPCRPRAFDLDAIQTTADLAKAAGKPAFVIFMAGPPRAPLMYQEAGELVQQFGLEVAPVRLPERAAFHHSVGQGKTAQEIDPTGKAAADMANLWTWVCQQLNLFTGKQVYSARDIA
jgi:chromosome partitioning protein